MPDEPLTTTPTAVPSAPATPIATSNEGTPSTGGNTVADAVSAFSRYQQGGDSAPSTGEVNEDGTPATEAPTEVEPQASEPTGTPQRDFSGLDPDEIPIFKKMGNEAFAYLKPKWLESKKAREDHTKLQADYENASKTSFYEHENAYQLTPEFREYAGNIQLVDREIQHWENQLARIEAGETWIPIILDAKGDPAIGNETPASPQARAQVTRMMQNAQIMRGKMVDKLDNLRTDYTTQHKSYLNQMTAVEDKIFAGTDRKVLDQAMQTKLSIFPRYLHGRAEVKIIAKLLAVVDGFSTLLSQKNSAAASTNIRGKLNQAAGPKGGSIQTGAVKANSVGSAMDEFNRAKAAGVF